MKDYNFIPQKKFKILYDLINIIIIIPCILCLLFTVHMIFKSIPLCIFCLFNGLWSINGKWYSWMHRNDESYNVKYV